MLGLNPRFPWRIEKAHWYLMFLYFAGCVTDAEFDTILERIKKAPGSIYNNVAS